MSWKDVGIGQLVKASIFVGSALKPSSETMYPNQTRSKKLALLEIYIEFMLFPITNLFSFFLSVFSTCTVRRRDGEGRGEGVRSSGYADEIILGREVFKGDAGKKWPCSNVRKGKIERVHFLIKKKLHRNREKEPGCTGGWGYFTCVRKEGR